jgi:ribosomal protein S27E
MLTACLCGGDPECDLSENRRKKRQEALAALREAESMLHDSGDARRAVETARTAVAWLQDDVYEVRCPDCGRWVYAATMAAAEHRWNIAIAKLHHLDTCCQASTDRRVDPDGLVRVKCATCGRIHCPLEPTV